MTSVFLTTIGMAAWVAGLVLGYPGIATIGGVMVVGVGGAVMVDGLEVRDGQTEALDDATNTTTVDWQYEEVQTVTSFPLGAVLCLLGGAQTLRSLDESTEF